MNHYVVSTLLKNQRKTLARVMAKLRVLNDEIVAELPDVHPDSEAANDGLLKVEAVLLHAQTQIDDLRSQWRAKT